MRTQFGYERLARGETIKEEKGYFCDRDYWVCRCQPADWESLEDILAVKALSPNEEVINSCISSHCFNEISLYYLTTSGGVNDIK